MAFVTNKGVIGAKLEGTPFTAETLAGTDFDLRAMNIVVAPEITMTDHKIQSGRYSKAAATVGKQMATISFDIFLTYSGAVATAPNVAKLLKGCGLKETAFTTVGISWTPNQANDCVPMTIEARYLDCASTQSQHIWKISGAMGNVVFSFDEIGQPYKMAFEFKGVLVSESQSTSVLTMSSADTAVPDEVISSTLTLASGAVRTDSFTLDAGNQIEAIVDPSKAQGLLGFQIVDRVPVMTLSPEIQLGSGSGDENTYPYYTNWKTPTTGAFSMTTSNFKISAPAAQVKSYSVGDRNGMVIREVTFDLIESSGNDEFELLQGAKA